MPEIKRCGQQSGVVGWSPVAHRATCGGTFAARRSGEPKRAWIMATAAGLGSSSCLGTAGRRLFGVRRRGEAEAVRGRLWQAATVVDQTTE